MSIGSFLQNLFLIFFCGFHAKPHRHERQWQTWDSLPCWESWGLWPRSVMLHWTIINIHSHLELGTCHIVAWENPLNSLKLFLFPKLKSKSGKSKLMVITNLVHRLLLVATSWERLPNADPFREALLMSIAAYYTRGNDGLLPLLKKGVVRLWTKQLKYNSAGRVVDSPTLVL